MTRARRMLAGGLHPRKVVEAMNRILPEPMLIYCDIGNLTAWLTHDLRRELPGTFHTDTVYGSMDYAIPAAIGGKLAMPDRPVCAVVGDGGALMGSLLDVFTAVEQHIPISVIVFNDGGWGMLEHGISQTALRDAPRPSFRFEQPANFAQIARGVHAEGVEVRTMAQLSSALRRCIAPERPIVLDVRIDPQVVPPIGGRTGHVTRHMHGGK